MNAKRAFKEATKTASFAAVFFLACDILFGSLGATGVTLQDIAKSAGWLMMASIIFALVCLVFWAITPGKR